jgi:DNA-binding transcriptional ArsR family regulator
MSSGIASLHKILKDESRRSIILLLNEKGSLSYTELLDASDTGSTGLLNYHLKVLDDLLSKNGNGKYILSLIKASSLQSSYWSFLRRAINCKSESRNDTGLFPL